MQRANICLSYGVLSKGCISNASLAFAKKCAPLNFHAFHFYSRDFQSFDCVCVCFVCVPEIPPPPALQTQNGFAVVGQKRLVVSGPVARDCATHYICRDGQRPHQTKKPDTDTSQQTTKASQLPRHRRLTGTTVRFVRYMS